MLIALPSFAQQPPQILSVAFDTTFHALPLSDWLVAGIALLLAASALITIRRNRGRGARFFGVLVALAAGSVLFSMAGPRVVQQAHALLPSPAISLISSPGTLDVSPYLATSPLTVTVTNNTGELAHITAVTLGNGVYAIGAPTTCTVDLVMTPGSTCTVTLTLTSS